MTIRFVITALALGLPLATGACAMSGAGGGYAYRAAPPSSNPHDYFRTVTRESLAAEGEKADAVAVERPR